MSGPGVTCRGPAGAAASRKPAGCLALLLACLGVAGCGQKGALYLPEEPQEVVVAPPAEDIDPDREDDDDTTP